MSIEQTLEAVIEKYEREVGHLRAQLRTAKNDALEEAAKEADRLGQEWWATKLRAMKE